MRYYDREGNEIVEGSFVELPDGRVEKTVLLEDETLGYDAINPDYRKRHPEVENEYYSYSAVAEDVKGEWAFVVDGIVRDAPQSKNPERTVKNDVRRLLSEGRFKTGSDIEDYAEKKRPSRRRY